MSDVQQAVTSVSAEVDAGALGKPRMLEESGVLPAAKAIGPFLKQLDALPPLKSLFNRVGKFMQEDLQSIVGVIDEIAEVFTYL